MALNFGVENQQQILRELKTNMLVECPYIVSFYGSFYEENAVHIVLEYMDGGSLSDVLGICGAVPEAVLCQITLQVQRFFQRCFEHRLAEQKKSKKLIIVNYW